jgi:PKD repeat protein
VNFSWSPIGARVGDVVTFTATVDKAPLTGSVLKWRFPNDSRPQGTTAKYTFTAPGSYTIRVELEQPGRTTLQREKPVVISP